MRKYLLMQFLLIMVGSLQNINAQNWLLNGNNTTASSLLGTLNSQPLVIITKNGERIRIDTFGRVGIGTSLPASSALLDLSSNVRGFLTPRMTTAQRTAIVSPVQGLLVFQTDGTRGFYYYDGTWKAVTPVTSGFATKNLSNLSAITAINSDLLAGINNARNLGSKAFRWKNIYFNGDIYKDTFRFISTQGLANLWIGTNSGIGITTGFDDLGVGDQTLRSNTTGFFNTAIGIQAMQNNTDGYKNTGVGYAALFSNITGINNTAVGHDALFYNTIGYGNTAGGQQALLNNIDGNANTATGDSALASNVNGSYNTANGFYSLMNLTGSIHNTAIGAYSLYSNNNSDNTATGFSSLYNNLGYANTALGTWAMYYNYNGNYNTAAGYYSLYNNNSGNSNTAMGNEALFYNYSGWYNVAAGSWSLHSNNAGNNVAIGTNAMYYNTGGGYNVAVGDQALINNYNSYNTGVGVQAGYYNSLQGTFVGAYTGGYSNLYNCTAIGYNAWVTGSNSIVLGNNYITSISGKVGFTTFSDGRYKNNIRENVPGLEFINQLRPITYNLNVEGMNEQEDKLRNSSNEENLASRPTLVQQRTGLGISPSAPSSALPEHIIPDHKPESRSEDREAKETKSKIVYTGFVAQEVEKAAKKLGYEFSGVDAPKTKEGFYGLRYGDFVVPLVKAVQELSKKTDEIDELKKENEDLKARLEKMEKIVLGKSGFANVSVSDITLEQNRPNPFDHNTYINYSITRRFSSAQLLITDYSGKTIKQIQLTNSSGTVHIDASLLSSGEYNYSIIVDGKQAQTKRMTLVK